MQKMVTSIKISAQLHQDMLQKVVASGYGLRGKNKWILEAIEQFFQIPHYVDLVDIASEQSSLTKVISIRINEDLVRAIDDAVIDVRKVFPTLEGVKSNIIRASIFQRLLRE
ncbi:MAG: hypothetical protein AAGG80_05725 [Pseudomonadota bacterium]